MPKPQWGKSHPRLRIQRHARGQRKRAGHRPARPCIGMGDVALLTSRDGDRDRGSSGCRSSARAASDGRHRGRSSRCGSSHGRNGD
ncbi:hypothetical protein, partial [Escherichia coli]|uniref:hypothetical protein n=1 Tax=Escherichia coli TaxID=562 RepID=UPI00200D1326